MDWPRQFVARIVSLFRTRKLDVELDEELRFHLEMEEREYLRRGMHLEEARSAARRSFGGVEQTKEVYRDARGIPLISDFVQDLRFGLRFLGREPRFTIAAALTLGLGVGALTTIFSVFNVIAIKPPPFTDSDRLVYLWEVKSETGEVVAGRRRQAFDEWAKALESAAWAFNYSSSTKVLVDSVPVYVKGQYVSSNLFETLGVEAMLGRAFSTAQLQTREVVISYGLWQRLYGGDPEVLGRKMVCASGAIDTIVGVMPRHFWVTPWTAHAELWRTFNWRGGGGDADIIGRMWSDYDLDQTRAALEPLAAGERTALGEEAASYVLRVEPLRKMFQFGSVDYPMFRWGEALNLLFGAVVCVLLVAGSNVGALLLSRTATRGREIATRAAVGAGRGRLVRQLLTESLMLGLLGGAVGLVLAYGGVMAFVAAAPDWHPRMTDVTIDARTSVFAIAASLLSVLLFGVTPAVHGVRSDLNTALKQGGRMLRSADQRGSPDQFLPALAIPRLGF
jgi:predicted permease